jgi:hypothetical protein
MSRALSTAALQARRKPASMPALLMAAALFGWPLAPGLAQTPPASAGPVDPAVIEDLVAASRILADQGVLDGFGHVSIRHPGNPGRLLMSRSLAPALTTAGDILEYDLDCKALDDRGRASFLERSFTARSTRRGRT